MVKQTYTVITGASSGIGYETARAFAKRGKHLILIARRSEKLNELKQELLREHPTLDIVILPTDLSITKNVYQVFNEAAAYPLETWINNAGFGMYGQVADNELNKIETMLHLNVEALTLLSTLFVKKYQNVPRTQLINISSAGGYTLVPTAVVYCATKFFVSAFTEGLASELLATDAKLRAKVLAPAATQTAFGKIANNVSEYNYDQAFGTYHTSKEMAEFLLQLYDSDQTIGYINRDSFTFELSQGRLPTAVHSSSNQKLEQD
ncbi:SDR family NAD(P)-dependent oxidoreductase [Enterococcus sp. AZ109]|uniref:SDR family NAD(P)-dependent oxidoreductase n=1 Tax=Enterococcus sp. AZ109 TaxID=2774634 RepID=UPI003F297967